MHVNRTLQCIDADSLKILDCVAVETDLKCTEFCSAPFAQQQLPNVRQMSSVEHPERLNLTVEEGGRNVLASTLSFPIIMQAIEE